MAQLIRTQFSTGNVSISGKSGYIRHILVQDATDANGDFDATIAINVDGTGSVTYTLNNFTGSNAAGAAVDNTNTSSMNTDEVLVPIAQAAASSVFALQIPLKISFTSSLTITFANNSASFVVWDEETF